MRIPLIALAVFCVFILLLVAKRRGKRRGKRQVRPYDPSPDTPDETCIAMLKYNCVIQNVKSGRYMYWDTDVIDIDKENQVLLTTDVTKKYSGNKYQHELDLQNAYWHVQPASFESFGHGYTFHNIRSVTKDGTANKRYLEYEPLGDVNTFISAMTLAEINTEQVSRPSPQETTKWELRPVVDTDGYMVCNTYNIITRIMTIGHVPKEYCIVAPQNQTGTENITMEEVTDNQLSDKLAQWRIIRHDNIRTCEDPLC